jgi:hypothetical protein
MNAGVVVEFLIFRPWQDPGSNIRVFGTAAIVLLFDAIMAAAPFMKRPAPPTLRQLVSQPSVPAHGPLKLKAPIGLWGWGPAVASLVVAVVAVAMGIGLHATLAGLVAGGLIAVLGSINLFRQRSIWFVLDDRQIVRSGPMRRTVTIPYSDLADVGLIQPQAFPMAVNYRLRVTGRSGITFTVPLEHLSKADRRSLLNRLLHGAPGARLAEVPPWLLQ